MADVNGVVANGELKNRQQNVQNTESKSVNDDIQNSLKRENIETSKETPNSENETSNQLKTSTATQYCRTLRQSLSAYQYHQSMTWIHMNTMYAFHSMMNANLMQQQTNTSRPTITTPPQTPPQRTQNPQGHSQNGPSQPGSVYRLATLPQRVAAEIIDFVLLFVVKLAVTMVAVEQLGILDLDQYEARFEKFLHKDLDYKAAFNLTSDLIALEILNRIFICFFEAFCLRRGIGRIGGATPGKRIVGIRVVSCQYIRDVGQDRVQVIPANDMGFCNALVRSVVKNFSLTFFFPACFTVLFFQHNRAAYDHIANCVVVKDPHPRR